MLGYDFDVEYRLGVENKATNILSHIPEEVSLAALSISQALILEELTQQVEKDESLRKVMLDFEGDHNLPSGVHIGAGSISVQGPISFAKRSSYHRYTSQRVHDGPVGGHSGVLKT